MNIPSESTIPEGDNAKVKPTEAELLSNHGRAEKNRPQRHEGFQKRVGQRREPLSKKVILYSNTSLDQFMFFSHTKDPILQLLEKI